MKRPLDVDALDGTAVELPAVGNQRRAVHVFERESLLAVNAAIDCGRPLLVRGKPGVGKSQLAWAVARKLGRVFISVFIDARTEAHELMWTHDAVTRLAEAQAWGHRVTGGAAEDDDAETRVAPDPAKLLARRRFVVPGPLWWAFDWQGAVGHVNEAEVRVPIPHREQDEPEIHPDRGTVLLFDEIDKADGSVPNGLLGCLGQGEFSVPGIDQPIRIQGVPPLVILTTNDDRVLPDAFVRRCVVLWLRLPEPGERFDKDREQDPLVGWLVTRGRAHFGAELEDHYVDAAVQVVRDRRALAARLCAPGLAEYIDLLAALRADRSRTIDDLARFFLRKHADPGPRR